MSTARALMAVARAQVAKQRQAEDRAVTMAIAGWFAAPSTAAQLPDDLLGLLTATGIAEDAAAEAGAMTASVAVLGQTNTGSPSWTRVMTAVDRVANAEPMMRAQYVVNAARRLTDAENYDTALRNEQRYFNDHLAAAANRRDAAAQIDGYGNRVLRWVTAGDSKVHPRCRRMEGRLFTASNLPDGLVPGGVRVGCRCRAVPWGQPLWAISEF